MQFRSLPVSTRRAAIAMVGLMAFLIWDQHHWWKLRDEYAFGFLVPLFVAYILFDRWPRIFTGFRKTRRSAADPAAGSSSGSQVTGIILSIAFGLLTAGGLAAFLAGILYRAMEGQNLIASNLLAAGFASILLGAAYLYSGTGEGGRWDCWQTAMLFLFPATIWMLSVPMFSVIHHSVSTFLMNKVAVVVFTVFDLLGFAVVREGSILRLPLGDVGVEDACSGIRSLTACLFAGSFLGAVYFEAFWKKVLLVFTAMLFAFFNNVLRSLFLTGWAYHKGPSGLEGEVRLLGLNLGNVHDVTGWLVLILTVLCLLALVKLFSIRLEYELPDSKTP